jgi:hypothetical protein
MAFVSQPVGQTIFNTSWGGTLSMRAGLLVCTLALAHSSDIFAQIARLCNASSSTEATGWLINGSRVLERLNESSADPITTALLCQSVSYSTTI